MSLASFYEKGIVFPQDYKLAYIWYSIAAKSGKEKAIEKVNELEKHLTQNEIEVLIGRAELCLESSYKECNY